MLRSEHVGDDFAISVARPHRYDEAGPGYPVIVVLDAHWLFGTVRDLTTSLSMARTLPRAIVVGVGYPTGDLAEVASLRQRDATPTSAPFPDGGRFGAVPGRYGTGGADRFRAFLVEELRPWLVERNNVGGPWVLVGHSLTALFGVHTLLNQPDAFDAYLLASPSLWWDQRVMLSPDRLAADGRSLSGDVYVSVGGDEDAAATNKTFQMGANAATLTDHLLSRGDEGLRVRFDVLPGETHHSTTGQAVSHGLRHLLAVDPADAHS